MKKNILLLSAAMTFIATFVAISAVGFADSKETIARSMSVAGIMALGAVGLFVTSIVAPKE